MINIRVTSDLPLISCIEIPGAVAGSGHQAVRALGGEVSLTRVLGHGAALDWSRGTESLISFNRQSTSIQQHEKVFLRCNANDRFSKFLSSSSTRRSDVLLRVKRNRHTGKLISAVPLGIVIERVSFESMADFYCAPPETPRDVKFSVDYELSESITEPLFIPPSTFTRITSPFHYKFENNAFSPSNPPSMTKELQKEKHVNRFGESAKCVEVVPSYRASERSEGSHHSMKKDSQMMGTTRTPSVEPETPKPLEVGGVELLPPPPPAAGVLLSETDDDNSTSLDIDMTNTQSPSQHSSHARESILPYNSLNVRRRGGEDSFNAVFRFSDIAVPKEPPTAALSVMADPELLTEYGRLFEMRPIWLRTTLDQQLKLNTTLWKKKPALARTCFLLSDGPWRGALCRLGYDPRVDPESRRYQTIDFRDPYFRSVSWRTHAATNVVQTPSRQIATALSLLPSTRSDTFQLNRHESHFIPKPLRQAFRSDSLNNQLPGSNSILPGGRLIDSVDESQTTSYVASAELCFRVPPTRPSQLFQLHDIDDPGVQRLVEESPFLPTCSKESGWYSKEVMTKIRDLMLMSVKKMREEKERGKKLQIHSSEVQGGASCAAQNEFQ